MSKLHSPARGRAPLCGGKRNAIAAAAVLALTCGAAQAFDFDTGNPDLTVRWDNTARFNYGVRVEDRDPKIGNSALSDEGTYSFDKGDAVAQRLDLLSELDVIYKKRYGVRVSGAGWYDAAYGDKSKSNPMCRVHPQLHRQQLQRLHQALLSRRARANCSMPSSSAESTWATCLCRARPAATPSIGVSRSSWAATCTAFPTRRTRWTCRRASPRPVPKPRNCSVR